CTSLLSPWGPGAVRSASRRRAWSAGPGPHGAAVWGPGARGHQGHPLRVLAVNEEKESLMADPTMPALPAVRNLLEQQPDLLRALVEQTINTFLAPEADALCGAPYGQRSADRVNQRTGYRERRWDTRAGSI